MLGLSVLDGVLLGLLSIPSFVMLGEYIDYGELSVPYEAEMCGVLFGPIMVLLTAPVMMLAWSLRDRASGNTGRRALYVLVILPAVVWIFMFASLGDALVPSLLLGMPLLLLSAVAIPMSAFILHRDVMATLVAPYAANIHCRMCGALLLMAKEDTYVQCRRCSAINANPFSQPSAGGPPVLPSPDAGGGPQPENRA